MVIWLLMCGSYGEARTRLRFAVTLAAKKTGLIIAEMSNVHCCVEDQCSLR